jgi:hypothetical protein
MKIESRHQCLIYKGAPTEKLSLLAEIMISKLNEGFRCLYLNSGHMIEGMRSVLAGRNIDVDSEISKGRLVLSSEPVTVGNSFNGDILLVNLENAIDQALRDGFKGLWASGDMTWEFGNCRDFSSLLDYEMKLEELFKRRKELFGICQYHRDTLPEDTIRQGLLAHPSVVISDTLSRMNPLYLKAKWPADSTTSREINETIAALCSE